MDAEHLARSAIRRGTFTLRSGAVTDVYFDKWAVLTDPGIMDGITTALDDLLPLDFDLLAGPELGGAMLALAMTLTYGYDMLVVRKAAKSYGATKQIEGDYLPGQIVVLVEDVLTTGGSVIEAATVLRAAGLIVAHVLAIVDREEGAAQNLADAGLTHTALFTLAELLAAERQRLEWERT